jgi:large subunit ribosomal protein L30
MAKAKKEAVGTIKVTLVKSTIGRIAAHRASVAGLGLRRLNQTVEVQDTPANRGMINAVNYLLKVEA